MDSPDETAGASETAVHETPPSEELSRLKPDAVLGQLGNGAFTPGTGSATPVLAVSAADSLFSSVAVGQSFTCGMPSRGTSVPSCWGLNTSGQVGNGTTTVSPSRPVTVLSAAGVPLTGVVQVAAGGSSSCAVLVGGSIRCWGSNGSGLLGTGLATTSHASLTWAFIKRLRDTVKTKILVKGLVTAADARLAIANGLDGIVVSNHGGRAEDSGRSTIDALPEVVEAVGGKLPIIVDSGFRRGTDIVKALAMGASAVAVGRPYLWGLGAFGQAGVERVLEILQGELRSVMMQMGAPTLKDLVPQMVRRA